MGETITSWHYDGTTADKTAITSLLYWSKDRRTRRVREDTEFFHRTHAFSPPWSPVIGLSCCGALGEEISYYACNTVSSLTHTRGMISLVRVLRLDPSRRSHRLGRGAISGREGTSSCPSPGGLFNQRGTCHSLVSRDHARGTGYLK